MYRIICPSCGREVVIPWRVVLAIAGGDDDPATYAVVHSGPDRGDAAHWIRRTDAGR